MEEKRNAQEVQASAADSSIVDSIESKIFNIRGKQVMLDRDLAVLYGVKTIALNQAVKRNIERFPERYRFELSELEKIELFTNCDRFNTLKHSSYLPYAFTEEGVAMLATVLKSHVAAEMSIRIMDAFVAIRRFLSANAYLIIKDNWFRMIPHKNLELLYFVQYSSLMRFPTCHFCMTGW